MARMKEQKIKNMKSVIADIEMEGFQFEPDELEILFKVANDELTYNQARILFLNDLDKQP